jgi:phosphate starvation-inducible PhoH-like protein
MPRIGNDSESRAAGTDRSARAEPPGDGKAVVTSEVEIDDTTVLMGLSGPRNERLKVIERELGIECSLRGSTIFLRGAAESVAVAERYFTEAATLLRQGVPIAAHDVGRALRLLQSDPELSLRDGFDDVVTVVTSGAGRRPVGPRGLAQKRYVDAIRAFDLTFGIGPAGTGKTYLAMACAVAALQERRVKKIVLTRPAVEAGEKLGFLPGDLAEKVNPYLRPLFDALGDMMDIDRAQGMMTRGQIEVAPLAFMRGRTLNDSFVILDEAQNTTSEQMRMFLTRLGYNSRAVVTGDVTQVDLPDGRTSGLAEARALLSNVEGIAFCEFTDVDVVRHPLVQKIVVAYEQRDREAREIREGREGARLKPGPQIYPRPREPSGSMPSEPPPTMQPQSVAMPPTVARPPGFFPAEKWPADKGDKGDK